MQKVFLQRNLCGAKKSCAHKIAGPNKSSNGKWSLKFHAYFEYNIEMMYIFKKTIETLRLRLCIPCSIFTFYTAGYLSRKGLWCVRGLGLSRTCLSASLPLGNSVLSLLLPDPPFCPLPLDNVRVCGHQRVICRRLHIHLYPHQRNRSTHVHSPSFSEDSREIMLGYIKPC